MFNEFREFFTTCQNHSGARVRKFPRPACPRFLVTPHRIRQWPAGQQPLTKGGRVEQPPFLPPKFNLLHRCGHRVSFPTWWAMVRERTQPPPVCPPAVCPPCVRRAGGRRIRRTSSSRVRLQSQTVGRQEAVAVATAVRWSRSRRSSSPGHGGRGLHGLHSVAAPRQRARAPRPPRPQHAVPGLRHPGPGPARRAVRWPREPPLPGT